MGYQEPATISALASSLAKLPFDRSTIFVASTDWQHYRPASTGGKMDSLGMCCLAQLDLDRLQKYFADGSVEACGAGPLIAVVKAAIAQGADHIKILRHGDSGDITGDKSSVVGYVAAVLYRAHSGGARTDDPPPAKLDKEPEDQGFLTDADKQKLCQIARQSIQTYLKDGSVPTFEVNEGLKKNGAAFVTLTKQGQLRGCIGMTEALMPLNETVAHCAVSAAVNDPRFRPVTADELPKLDIEISVLTPLTRVTSLDSIKIGRDGLMIQLGQSRGLLLPQVATEYDWDRKTFLEQTCQKAGLPSDSYKDPDAILYRFQAIIFREVK